MLRNSTSVLALAAGLLAAVSANAATIEWWEYGSTQTVAANIADTDATPPADTIGVRVTGGTVTFTGDSSYTGGTEVTGGIFAANTATAAGSALVSVSGSGQFKVNAAGLTIANDFAFTGTSTPVTTGGLYSGATSTLNGQISLSGNYVTVVAGSQVNITFNGKITGDGGLYCHGSQTNQRNGWFYVYGDNDFTGDTRIDQGQKVIIYNANGLGSSASTVTLAGTSGYGNVGSLYTTAAGGLSANKSFVLNPYGALYQAHGLTLSNSIAMNGGILAMYNNGSTANARHYTGSITLAAGTVNTFNRADGRGTWYQDASSVISGDGAIYLQGGDQNGTTMYFQGTNTYKGGTTVTTQGYGSGGQVHINNGSAFGTGVVNLTGPNEDATFHYALNHLTIDNSITMANDFTGTGRVVGSPSSNVLTTTGAIYPGAAGTVASIYFQNLDFRGQYDFDFGYTNTGTVADPVYTLGNDLITTDNLAFGGGTATLNATWIDESGAHVDPEAGEYVLFTYAGSDPSPATWTLNLPAGLSGEVNVGGTGHEGTVWVNITPEPAPAGLLGLGLLPLLRRRRGR